MTTCQIRGGLLRRRCGRPRPCPTHEPAAALRVARRRDHERWVLAIEEAADDAADRVRRQQAAPAPDLLHPANPASPLNPLNGGGYSAPCDPGPSYGGGSYGGSSDSGGSSGSSDCGGGSF